MKIGKTLEVDTTQPVVLDDDTTMTVYEMSRWCLLIKGIEAIHKKGHQLGVDMDKNSNWVKPLALQKYIDAETPAMVTEVISTEDLPE